MRALAALLALLDAEALDGLDARLMVVLNLDPSRLDVRSQVLDGDRDGRAGGFADDDRARLADRPDAVAPILLRSEVVATVPVINSTSAASITRRRSKTPRRYASKSSGRLTPPADCTIPFDARS